jgi:hypothetical protein
VKPRRARARIWPAPIALGVVTTIGLIAALVSESAGDLVGWLALAAPVVVVLWFSKSRGARP